jgi:LmbE family N-acetylglucosaminyl deacetylase
MPTALALSPHLDDAAFSCGGLLASLAQDGWRVVMATLFTGSVADPQGFALACQLDKGLAAEIDYMALRRDEDVRAAAALGIAPPVHLPFREAPHRGYGSAPELFSDTRADDGIAADLAPVLTGLIAAEKPDLVLAPQAIGGHVDHVQAVRALRSLDVAAPILWWRDFPYTVREATPKEPLAGLFATLAEARMRLDPDTQASSSTARPG